MIIRMLASILAVLIATSAFALGESEGEGGGLFGEGGGNGCGGIQCLPEALRDSAGPLRESLELADIGQLIEQKYDRVLCDRHPCGAFSEDVAADFVDDLISFFQREEDQKIAQRGLYAGLAGAFLAVVALCQTHLANKRLKNAENRSIRNEAHLAYLEGENK